MNMSEDNVELQGEVITVHGNNNYRVRTKIAGKDQELLCYLSGDMRRFRITVVPGDTVTLVVSPPFDRGRITYRSKG